MSSRRFAMVLTFLIIQGCSQPHRRLDDWQFDADPADAAADADHTIEPPRDADEPPPEPPWGDEPCLRNLTGAVVDDRVTRFSASVGAEYDPRVVAAVSDGERLQLLIQSEHWLCLARLDAELELTESHLLRFSDPEWPYPYFWYSEVRPEGTLFMSIRADQIYWILQPHVGVPSEVVVEHGLSEEDHSTDALLPVAGVVLYPWAYVRELRVSRWIDGVYSGSVLAALDGIYPRILSWGERRFLTFHRVDEHISGPFLIELDQEGSPLGGERLIGETGMGDRLTAAPLGDRWILAWQSLISSYSQAQVVMVVDEHLEPVVGPVAFDSRGRVDNIEIVTEGRTGLLVYFDQQRVNEAPTDVVVRPIHEDGTVAGPSFEYVASSPYFHTVGQVQGRWIIVWSELWETYLVRLH